MKSAVIVDTTRSKFARLRPVPLTAITLTDSFWAPRLRTNREVTLPSQYEQCEKTGRIDNFRRASGKKKCDFQGIYFNDSDVYKWLEAASWTLATEKDAALEKMVDSVAQEIADAQQPDGYLNTYFMFEKAAQRFTNLKDMHELYCAGHFIQAAIAHHRATGSDKLLHVARRLADHFCSVFGLKSEGKREGTDGHEEIEMAMFELARTTGEEKYLKLATFFVDIRGRGTVGGSHYHQDHKPFRELDEMTGHAVRAVYLNCGAADYFAETGDQSLRVALDRLWENMTAKRMYVSGGLGSRHEGEAFGKDYELPNERAYTETCAAIGSVMWNWRMLLLDGDARYADLLEHTLYNAVLPGLSLDGRSYFYQNPLANDGTHRRQPWFGCACCPPNISRLFASLPGYFYSVSGGAVWVHLYAAGTANITLPSGQTVRLTQTTNYPWDGKIEITIENDGTFALMLRIPSWCEKGASLKVNGKPQKVSTPGSYAKIRRTWRGGDTLLLSLPMPVRRVVCHPYVAENAGRVALMRGPLLYCLEQADHRGFDLRDVIVPAHARFEVVPSPKLLGGVTVLKTRAKVSLPDKKWRTALYRASVCASGTSEKAVNMTAIPYYAWANRRAGPMHVWLRSK